MEYTVRIILPQHTIPTPTPLYYHATNPTHSQSSLTFSPTILSPISVILSITAASRTQWGKKCCEKWYCFVSPCVPEAWTGITGLTITDSYRPDSQNWYIASSSLWGLILVRGGSRAAATSKMESFVIIVNGCQPLTIITKRSILDVAAALDPPLLVVWMANHSTLSHAVYIIRLLPYTSKTIKNPYKPWCIIFHHIPFSLAAFSCQFVHI